MKTSRDYPNNIIPLFPKKIETNPLEHPVVKEFLTDASIHTKVHAHDSEDDEVFLTWVAGDDSILVVVNVTSRIAEITAVNREENEILSAVVEIGPDHKNRWVGYFIDDRT